MDQKLTKQIKNEWRSNLWLALELFIVSVVMWYVVDYFYVAYRLFNEPLGFDIEHCYQIEVSTLNEKSPDFVADATGEDYEQWRSELLDRLSRRPEIEAAGIGFCAYPYNNSNSCINLDYDTINASGFIIRRSVSPGFIRAFRYTGIKGETPEQLAEILDRGEILVSENLFANGPGYEHLDKREKIEMARNLLGKSVHLGWDTTRTYKVGAILKTVKYAEHLQGQMNRTIVMNINHDYPNDWVVRVRAGLDKDFEKNLRADLERHFRIGNLYVANIKPFSRIKEAYMMETYNTMRNMFTGMGFLMLNIFLGLLGTFWFRTQQRTRDIAVRMVSGARRVDIFRLLICEGMLLLAIVTPFALAVDVNLAKFELNADYDGFFSWGKVLLCAAIAYVIMAAMVIAGIAIPAYRAMRITPANALRDE